MESRSRWFCLLYIYLVFVHTCVHVYMHADIRVAHFLPLPGTLPHITRLCSETSTTEQSCQSPLQTHMEANIHTHKIIK